MIDLLIDRHNSKTTFILNMLYQLEDRESSIVLKTY